VQREVVGAERHRRPYRIGARAPMLDCPLRSRTFETTQQNTTPTRAAAGVSSFPEVGAHIKWAKIAGATSLASRHRGLDRSIHLLSCNLTTKMPNNAHVDMDIVLLRGRDSYEVCTHAQRRGHSTRAPSSCDRNSTNILFLPGRIRDQERTGDRGRPEARIP
jgi:hypothetical protein